jgi:hypothetical protein
VNLDYEQKLERENPGTDATFHILPPRRAPRENLKISTTGFVTSALAFHNSSLKLWPRP